MQQIASNLIDFYLYIIRRRIIQKVCDLEKMQKSTKIKIAVLVLLVGMACLFAAVVTDHWAVLSPQVHQVNETCEAAHFGLWRLCKKHIYIRSETYKEGQSCGPISLPGGELETELLRSDVCFCMDGCCLSVGLSCLLKSIAGPDELPRF